MSYGNGAGAYGKHSGLEHSKDGMSHASEKNVAPAFDTGFYEMGHAKHDPSSYEGGSSPDSVKAPQAAR